MVRPVRALVACAAFALAGCGPTPIEVLPPVEPPPPPPLPEPAMVHRPPQVLQVAVDPSPYPYHRMVTVDARRPRTPIGHFFAGAHLRIRVLEARWTYGADDGFFDAAGKPDQRCGSPGHTCIGGDDTAPLMGLILLTVPNGAPAAPVVSCAPQHRLFVPSGVEFAVPEETELTLAPNDWADDLAGNSGVLHVEVETSSGREVRGPKRKVDVDARSAGTPLGRFRAGQYVRVTVAGGRWSHAGQAAVDAAGMARLRCASMGGHACLGGDAAAPRMGLMLLVGPCAATPARPRVERQYIPRGIETVVRQESDLFLGPNDWEDGCFDNAGAAIVEVESDAP